MNFKGNKKEGDGIRRMKIKDTILGITQMGKHIEIMNIGRGDVHKKGCQEITIDWSLCFLCQEEVDPRRSKCKPSAKGRRYFAAILPFFSDFNVLNYTLEHIQGDHQSLLDAVNANEAKYHRKCYKFAKLMFQHLKRNNFLADCFMRDEASCLTRFRSITHRSVAINHRRKNDSSSGYNDRGRMVLGCFAANTCDPIDVVEDLDRYCRGSEMMAGSKWRSVVTKLNHVDILNRWKISDKRLVSKHTVEDRCSSETAKDTNYPVNNDQLIKFTTQECQQESSPLESVRSSAASLVSVEEPVKSEETEEMTAWFSAANVVEVMLRAYKTVGCEEISKAIEEEEFVHQRPKLSDTDLEEDQKTIEDLLRRGELCIADEKLGQFKQNQVVNEMKNIEERWKTLKDRVVAEQYHLASVEEPTEKEETEETRAWFSDAKVVKDMLAAYETAGSKEIDKAIEEEEFVIQRPKLLDTDLEEDQKTIEALLTRGELCIADENLCQFRQSEIVNEMKNIEERWKTLKDRVAVEQYQFRLSIVEYFSAECKAATQKVECYESDISMHNTDEKDLNAVKKFFIHNEQIMEELRKEQLVVDNLALFADKVSQKGVLTNDDHNTITTTINGVYETFGRLRRQCQERTNRVYGEMMQNYNHRLQRITEDLNRVKMKAQKKMDELKNVKEFRQAIDTLLVAQELNDRVKGVSSEIALVTEQMDQWVDLPIIKQTIDNRLKEKSVYCVPESISASKDVENLVNRIQDEIRDIFSKRVASFWVWLPMMEKRSKEIDESVLDFDSVAEQVKEMKVIQAETDQMSFSCLLDPYKSNNILEFLTIEERMQLMSANDQWINIKNCVDERLETLSRAEEYWSDFNLRKTDLELFLKIIEHKLKAVNGIHLNDMETVKLTSSACLSATGSMEARKDHVSELVDAADRLTNLLSITDHKSDEENNMRNSILSQVADILDSWNTNVRRSIALRSKLHTCMGKFESCCSLYQEISDWVDDSSQLLNRFQGDACGEHVDILKVKLESKENEEEVFRKKLQDVNALEEELLHEDVVCPTFTLPGNVKTLNKDFEDTIEKLHELKKFPGNVKMLSRQVCGVTKKLMRNLATKWEGHPPQSPASTATT